MRTPAASSSRRARWPSSSAPSRQNSVASPARRASSTAATPPPPAGSSHVSSRVAISPGRGHRLDAQELDPLHMPDDGHVHGTLTDAAAPALQGMMEAVATDPAVRALLRRAPRRRARLPPPAARAAGRRGRLPGDVPARAARLRPARARRAPARLGADDRRAARDRHRAAQQPDGRTRCPSCPSRTAAPPTPSSSTSPTPCRPPSAPPSSSATPTTCPTPTSPRRSDSTPEAARQAASSGVRRLRTRGEAMSISMTVPADLDRRFREAAATAGPARRRLRRRSTRPIGPLLVAATDRGLCRISFDADPERTSTARARLRAARPPLGADRRRRAPPARRVLRGRSATSSSSRSTSRGAAPFARAGAGRARARAVRPGDDLRHARRQGRRARGRARGRHRDEPQPDPDRAALPPRRRRERQPDGYGGGLDVKERLLRLEGAML